MQKKKQSNFWRGFVYAWRGIVWNFTNERNMVVHGLVLIATAVLGVMLQISKAEWLVLLVFFALVPAMELVNSAIESCCDTVRDQLKLDYGATRIPRDLAAGAVLWAALMALLAGLIIFIPKLIFYLG